MKYNGKDLILDNFREVLKGYSIDIQDIVRSAILDGIDISDYIQACRNNPSRLEQIRLCIKEGFDSALFKIKSGNCLYKIRKLEVSVLNVVVSKIKEEDLSEDLIETVIDWAKSGYNLHGINIAIIPKNLYEVYEQGFKKGFDMRPFNNGVNYKPDYIRYCFMIMNNGKDISPFVSNNESLYQFWDYDCLKLLASFSKVKHRDKWVKLINNIDSSIKSDKLKLLITCVKNNIDISLLSKKEWSIECIGYIIQAYENDIDYKKLIDIGPDCEALSSALNDLILVRSKKVSGRFRK